MPTAQKLAEQIKNLEEEIQQKENRLLELKQQHKVQAGKEQTHSRIERAKILENLIEESDTLTDEQIKSFLEKTIQTNFARKILTDLKGQNAAETEAGQATPQGENSEDTGKKSEIE